MLNDARMEVRGVEVVKVVQGGFYRRHCTPLRELEWFGGVSYGCHCTIPHSFHIRSPERNRGTARGYNLKRWWDDLKTNHGWVKGV